jgi:hypothetical protein
MSKRMYLKPGRFFIICLALGVICEQCFFHGKLGLSYPVFILFFYGVFMWRFRKGTFHHRRIGLLLMACIGILSATYLVYDNFLFYLLNFIVLPALVVCHCIILVSPKDMSWHQPQFISYVFIKFKRLFTVNLQLFSVFNNLIKKRVSQKRYDFIKKITIGIAISLPLLLVILILLVSADAVFGKLISRFPNWIAHLNITDSIFRLVVILLTTLIFFGFFQGLNKKERMSLPRPIIEKNGDKVIIITVLILINSIYTLFTLVQFGYFFGGKLVTGLTYAEYARHGFMQLLFVTIINLTILVIVLHFIRTIGKKRSIQILLTLMVTFSGVMLLSAFKRLLLYEEAYGYTVSRMLAHAFMLFLVIIFAYTLVKIWIHRLSLAHFYIISTLIFYTTLNLIHIDHWVANENLVRYEQTGKIDIDYMNRLSATGVMGLIDLYKENPDIPKLADILALRKEEAAKTHTTWQSYNLVQKRVNDALKSLDVPNHEVGQ